MSILATPYPIALSHLQKTTMFNTDITVGKSGYEIRNANWQDPLRKYNAAAGIKTRADVALLEAFFLSCRGREKGFLLQDLTDYAIPQSGSTAQQIGVGNGATTTFQIYKRYTDALSNNYDRTITRPSPTTSDVLVYVDSVLKTYSTHYTYSTTTGVITFVSAPSSSLPVQVQVLKYYVPVRFDTDELPVDLLCHWVDSGTPYSLMDLPEVPLIEIREA